MKILQHEFVDFIPENICNEIIYISIKYKTAVHNCACGCGERVVTRLSPHDWKLLYDGKNISLYPSIGNWSFPCQSHYLIRNNKIIDVPKFKYGSSQDDYNEKVQRGESKGFDVDNMDSATNV